METQGQDIEAFEHDQMEALYEEARAKEPAGRSIMWRWLLPGGDTPQTPTVEVAAAGPAAAAAAAEGHPAAAAERQPVGGAAAEDIAVTEGDSPLTPCCCFITCL